MGPILNNHSLHLKANNSKQDYPNYLSTSCHKSKFCCNKVQSKCAKLSLAYFVTISLIIWILSYACLLATLVLLVAPFIVSPTLWTTFFLWNTQCYQQLHNNYYIGQQLIHDQQYYHFFAYNHDEYVYKFVCVFFLSN